MTYTERREARIERLRDAAEKAKREGEQLYSRARTMGECIPFGQPILVGHHSEKRDRNYRERINRTYDKAFQADNRASYYENRASAAENNSAISSDDPEAITLLKTKIAKAEAEQERYKAINKAIRQNKTPQTRIKAIIALGLGEATAQKLLEKDCFGGIGIPSYKLTNNNANINRMKNRLASLEKNSNRGDKETKYEGFTVCEDTTENRVMFIFPGKPDEGTRTTLKGRGFKWSPSRGAWVRMLNNAGRYAAQDVVAKLAQQEGRE